MAKSQVSRVDIRIGKGGLDQSETKNNNKIKGLFGHIINKVGEAFFHNKLSESMQKI